MQYPAYLKTVKVKRKKHRLRLVVAGALLLFVLFKAYGIKTDIFGGGASEPVMLEIKSGASFDDTARLLKEQRVIKYPLLFKLYSRFSGASGNIRFGGHSLTKDMSYSRIIKTISRTTAPLNAVTVTIPEGSELMQTAQKLSDAFLQKGFGFDINTFLGECENGNFNQPFVAQIPKQKNRLEGYLFPATYTFTEETSEHDVINAMLDKFAQEYNADFQEAGGGAGLYNA